MSSPFELLHLAGTGASAEVWAARHRATGRPLAVKLVETASPKALEAFHHEVRTVARLRHPNVVQILELGTQAGPPARGWLAMPWCEGTLAQHAPTTWSGIRRALEDLLAALAHAHAHGLTHRDVKPENLLRADAESWVLADFGIATKRADVPIAGTPATMAPEQIEGAPPAPVSDLYSVGCVAWWLATGSYPYGGTVEDQLLGHLSGALPAFRAIHPVPEGYFGWVEKLLHRRARARFQLAAHARRALLDLGGPTPHASGSADTVPLQTWAWDEDGTPTPPPPRRTVVPPSRPFSSAPLLEGDLADVGLQLSLLRAAPVVGRASERRQLTEALQLVASQRETRVVLLEGAPALHGHALAVDFARQAEQEGAARCWVVRERGWPTIGLDDALPRVLVVDLTGQNDEETLGSLLGSLGEAAILWLVCTSDPDRARGLKSLPGIVEVLLGPVDDLQIRALLTAMLPLEPVLSSEIEQRAGGRPGVALEWLRTAARAGWLRRGPHGFEGSLGELDAGVPEAALAAFGPAVKGLQLAAMHGTRVDRQVLERVAASTGTPVPSSAVLTRMQRLGWLELNPTSLQLGPALERSLRQLPLPERQRWHLAWADALAGRPSDRHRRGLHLQGAGRLAEAREELTLAAFDAHTQGDLPKAMSACQQAYALLDAQDLDSPDGARVAILQLRLRVLLDGRQDAKELERLEHLARHTVLDAGSYFRLAIVCWPDLSRAEALLHLGLAHHPESSTLQTRLAWLTFTDGRATEAVPLMERAVRAARGQDDEAWTLYMAALLQKNLGDPDRARALLRQLGEHSPGAFLQANAAHLSGEIATLEDRPSEAIGHYQTAIDIYRSLRFGGTWATELSLALTLLRDGQPEQAQRVLARLQYVPTVHVNPDAHSAFRWTRLALWAQVDDPRFEPAWTELAAALHANPPMDASYAMAARHMHRCLMDRDDPRAAEVEALCHVLERVLVG